MILSEPAAAVFLMSSLSVSETAFLRHRFGKKNVLFIISNNRYKMQPVLIRQNSYHHDHRVSFADFIFQRRNISGAILYLQAIAGKYIQYPFGGHQTGIRFIGNDLI